jgi:hypothetical protein
MSDSVAIVSVAFSGSVGLAGIAVSAFGATAQRRWQAREERLTELRSVLDSAGEALASAMQSFASAASSLDDFYSVVASGQDGSGYRSKSIGHMEDGRTAQRAIWGLSNRIKVRTGPETLFPHVWSSISPPTLRPWRWP